MNLIRRRFRFPSELLGQDSKTVRCDSIANGLTLPAIVPAFSERRPRNSGAAKSFGARAGRSRILRQDILPVWLIRINSWVIGRRTIRAGIYPRMSKLNGATLLTASAPKCVLCGEDRSRHSNRRRLTDSYRQGFGPYREPPRPRTVGKAGRFSAPPNTSSPVAGRSLARMNRRYEQRGPRSQRCHRLEDLDPAGVAPAERREQWAEQTASVK